MARQAQPEAPLPPTRVMGVPPGTQQLATDFERMHVQHAGPQYSSQGNSYTPLPDGHFHPHGQVPQPHVHYDDHGKVPITYKGWTFAKQVPTRTNQKATWSNVVRTPMSESQDHLRDLVIRQKTKGKSAIDLYNSEDMKGFKRDQVKRLIADVTRRELDQRFEYKLGFLKLDQRRPKPNQRETNSMVVVLKRVFRNGAEQPLGSGQARAQVLEGETVDLARVDDIAYNQSSHPIGYAAQYIAHSHPEYVDAQQYEQQQVYVDQRPAVHVVHPQEAMQSIPHQAEQYMAAHQQQQHELRYQQQGQQQHYREPHTHQQQEDQGHYQEPYTLHEQQEQHQQPHTPEKKKGDKKKDQKPEVHQKKEWQGKIRYESSSDSLSDNNSFFTNETPDTEYSGHSSHHYHTDKKQDFKRRSSHRDSRSRDHDHSPDRQVFRERRRKSPARSTHSGQEYEVVETIISTGGDHGRPYDRVYVKDRSGHLQRTSSYNGHRSSRPVYRDKQLKSYAHRVDERVDEEKERLQYEIAVMQRQKSEERREKARLESDRLERQKLELERERIEGQKERDRLERVKLEHEREKFRSQRYDRDDRGRFDDHHERPYPEKPYRERERAYAEKPYRERERRRRLSTDYDARREDLFY